MSDAPPVVAEVPELREAVLAHAKSRQVDKVRREVARDLAVAVYHASQIASDSLVARALGVTRQRVRDLSDKGARHLAAEKKGAKK